MAKLKFCIKSVTSTKEIEVVDEVGRDEVFEGVVEKDNETNPTPLQAEEDLGKLGHVRVSIRKRPLGEVEWVDEGERHIGEGSTYCVGDDRLPPKRK